MKTSPTLQLAFAIAAVYFGGTACVTRECTGDEAAAVGADGSDSCTTATLPVPHEGKTKTKTLDYTAGTGLLVKGDFRNLEIQKGPSGEVEVQYTPRVDLADGRTQDQIDATLAELTVTVEESGGNIVVNSKRSGDSNVAALVQVSIPDDFDGDIVVDQGGSKNDGGEVQMTSVGSSHSLDVSLPSTGDTLTVTTPNTLRTAVLNVHGGWDIKTGTFSSANLKAVTMTSELGNIKTSFSAVPLDGAAYLKSDMGDLTVALPGEGDYTMQATSADFTFDAKIPSSCDKATNGGGGSLTCGAGSSDKKLDFQFESDGAISIDRFLTSTQ
jgi:hypothetical protein